MKKIDEQIKQYEEVLSGASDGHNTLVRIELERINSLYDGYENHTDERFVNEIIESFCKILEIQREKIEKLDEQIDAYEAGYLPPYVNSKLSVSEFKGMEFSINNSVKSGDVRAEDFQNDKQLQSAFTQYCLINGTSSYTVNDYCSRIKKTWKSFEDDYRNGLLKDDLASKFPEIPWDGALMNVYYNIETLGEYIKVKIVETDGNRNWLNARAAINKFDEFRISIVKI